jgi:hypothetical protein
LSDLRNHLGQIIGCGKRTCVPNFKPVLLMPSVT